MAKEKLNRSQAVRDYLAEKPDAPAKEVVAALAEKGIKVSTALVYNVKGGMAERKRRKKRVAKAAMATTGDKASSNGTAAKADAITMIREVKTLARKAGGYTKLRELVDALAE